MDIEDQIIRLRKAMNQLIKTAYSVGMYSVNPDTGIEYGHTLEAMNTKLIRLEKIAEDSQS